MDEDGCGNRGSAAIPVVFPNSLSATFGSGQAVDKSKTRCSARGSMIGCSRRNSGKLQRWRVFPMPLEAAATVIDRSIMVNRMGANGGLTYGSSRVRRVLPDRRASVHNVEAIRRDGKTPWH